MEYCEMNASEFYLELDEVLELAPGTLQGGEALEGLEGWDSVAVITFIALADSQYGVVLPPTEIAACRTVSNLADLIARHRAPAVQ
jgi:acyl carrier protein